MRVAMLINQLVGVAGWFQVAAVVDIKWPKTVGEISRMIKKKKKATTTAAATLKVAYDPANDGEPAASPSGTLARAQP